MKEFKTIEEAIKFVELNYTGDNVVRISEELRKNSIAKVGGLILIVDEYELLKA